MNFQKCLKNSKKFFDREFMDRVLGAVTVMIPTSVNLEKARGCSKSIQEEMSIENEGSEEEEMESKPYIEPDYYTGCSRKIRIRGVYMHTIELYLEHQEQEKVFSWMTSRRISFQKVESTKGLHSIQIIHMLIC
mgnify:CR=1 FL=1